MAAGVATVKQVISADTIVLVGVPKGGPPPEKQLSLSSLIAPRVAMKSLTRELEDEPYGWTARELIREKLIGKEVEFKVEFTQGDREYGWLKLKGGESVSMELVKKGLARVKGNRNPPCAHDIAELLEAESAAKDTKVGLWSDQPGAGQATIRQITWSASNPTAVKQLYADHKNQRLNAIVEYVRDGGCVRVMFPDHWIYATVLVSGVACDGFKREAQDGGKDFVTIPEPFAAEARFFAEIRVLNRDVEVRLEGVEESGDIYGSIYHSNGNMALLLLKSGLAKIQEWSARLTESPAQLREAVKEAQTKRLRKWKNWEPAVLASEKEYSARVVEIVSGDSLMLQLSSSGPTAVTDRRVYLASVRCARLGNRTKADEPWAFEAKEFVRKKLIHKKVKVVLEYVREPMVSSSGMPPPPGSDAQGRLHFVSVIAENEKTSIAEQLLSRGLAKTQPHRPDDDRAENFDVLLDLEKAAEEKAVGMHGPDKLAEKHKLNDLLGTANAARARSYEKQLREQSSLEAVVEHIFNAGRFKLRIPAQNLGISFTLGGIRCPQTARPSGAGGPAKAGEPYADEALRHARDTLMQRDVTINIQLCDKGGNFIGALWVGKTNFATELLELGYACTMEFGSSAAAHKSEYSAAEQKAQASKLRIWSVFGAIEKHKGAGDVKDPQKELEKDDQFPVVTVSHINSLLDFYVQDASSNHAALSNITKLLGQYKDEESATTQYSKATTLPAVSDIVLAKFSADNHWYRGLVQKVQKDSVECRVFYLDYGNCEDVALTRIRRCPPHLSVKTHHAMAQHCALSGLLSPMDLEEDAAQWFHDFTEGKVFKSLVDGRKDGKRLVVLTEQEAAAATPGAESVNELLMREGYARLDNKSQTKIFTRLKKEEESARKDHRKVWQHGDVGDDDSDEDFPSLANGRAKPQRAR